MPDTATANGASPRPRWMSVLAQTTDEALERAWQGVVDPPPYRLLRGPETGLVMVRARAGGTGARFNLGEMTVTRCSVGLPDGTVGHAWVGGRSPRHAELAAVFDALLQDPERAQSSSEKEKPASDSRTPNQRPASVRARASPAQPDFSWGRQAPAGRKARSAVGRGAKPPSEG